MALIKCKECGHQMSTSAKQCPSCGAQGKRKTHWFTWFVAVVFGAPLLVGIVSSGISPTPNTQAAPRPMSPASAAAAAKREALFQQQLLMARALVSHIQKSARDPTSVVIEYAGATEDGKAACVEYRARNGFGGMNRESAVAVGSKAYTARPDLWNTHCANKPLRTLTSVI